MMLIILIKKHCITYILLVNLVTNFECRKVHMYTIVFSDVLGKILLLFGRLVSPKFIFLIWRISVLLLLELFVDVVVRINEGGHA